MTGPCVRRLDDRPDLLAVHGFYPDQWSFLLASEAGSPSLGRWSMLLRQSGERLCSFGSDGPGGDGFLARLRKLVPIDPAAATAWSQAGLPFCGGWFIYLGYELVGQIEPRLQLPASDDGLPLAFAARCPAALLFDHQDGATWLVGETPEWLERATAELARIEPGAAREPALPMLRIQADPPEPFIAGVRRIREWIVAGDVFQVNLSRGWRVLADEPMDEIALYRALAAANPAPFAGMARLPGGTVISSSPERLVELRDGLVQTRPIAGTRPRGRDDRHDRDLSSELLAHPKERAEHIMLIDLERNDLGRVCTSGSVEVNELMAVESYTHVHHIVSNVRGRLRPGCHPVDVIAAVFPGGTITGCPKVRCMEIIADLEQRGRSFYTGAMGYLGRDGAMDLNILIRSMAVSGQQLAFRTGAGIVADSDPEAELAETEAKARGLLQALGAA
ncbi:aminodeoxychorismate synthase component I [Wenzhouxiangella limi]|uniref:Aminodeoxychorismate synthase component I n=1 Tax=Wenzhouxiangella limi TaxID=2707351 RepID=A0A845UWB3_9GAMM|nr:aminodeoxychorismate synthase component I [Wenzhouxiangella limi]NDY94814.1 aminodeoxychorismate synthase component I [Wenzhouxiangella limi]